MTPNAKLKTAIAAVTNLIHQEGPLAFEQLLALTGKTETVLSAALNEMVNTGIITHGTDRATGNKKYVLTAQAKKEAAAAAAEKKAKAKPAPEPTPEAQPVAAPTHEPEPDTKTKRPAKPRAKRFTPNPMLGAYEHKGNVVLKLERTASQCVTLSPEDAEIFVALLTRMIDIAKRRQVAQ